MTTINGGRNEIPVKNSGAKCLLENWVEERAVSDIDPPNLSGDTIADSNAYVYKFGHMGIVTTEFDARAESLTTNRDHFRVPKFPGVRLTGSKKEALEKVLFEQVANEIHKNVNPSPPPMLEKSTFQHDYNIDDFISKKPPPTAHHDVNTDQAVTFWSEHRDKIHGVSMKKPTHNHPFRKNHAFSQPIDESWESPKPYEDDKVPNM